MRCALICITRKSQSNLGRAALPPLTQTIPLVTMESAKLSPSQNCPFPFDKYHQNLTCQYQTPPQPPSQRHPDPFSHFVTIPHFHTTIHQTSHWQPCNAPNLSPKLPLPLRRSPPKSNTPICGSSQITLRFSCYTDKGEVVVVVSRPTQHRQLHPNPFSYFARMPNAVRQTDRPWCVAVHCRALQKHWGRLANHWGALQCVVVHCVNVAKASRPLRCVAVHCSALQKRCGRFADHSGALWCMRCK